MPEVPSRWKSLRYRVEALVLRLLVGSVPKLSRRACVKLGNALGALAFLFDGRGRPVSLANLEAAFGDRYTPAERRRIARESYQYFARTMIDLFWSPAFANRANMKYIHMKGLDVLEDMRGKPSAFLTAHYAGFEWTSIACGLHGYVGAVLTQAFKNPLLSEFFTGLRTSTGQDILTQNLSMLRLLKRIKAGSHVGLLIDLTLPPTQAATVIETFGMKKCVTFLHAILHQRAGAYIVPMTSQPLPDGSCEIEIHRPLEIPADATEQQIAQASWDFYEPIVRARPECWIWAYKHWRFQPEGEAHRYPFYANRSGKFEKLLAEVRAKG